jgi:sn-glycerol 3-phosphate transport system substrate-binding protein
MKKNFLTALLMASSLSAPALAGTTEVVFWHPFSGATGEAFQSIVDDYNSDRGASQDIAVQAVFQGYQGTNKVTLAYQTKDLENAPDVNVGLTSTIPTMMELNWSVSAEDFMTAEGSELSKDDFYPAMQRATAFDGKMAAVPFANSIPLLYLNTAMLAEAGLDGAPETMEDVIAYTDALKVVKDGEVERYGLNMQVKRYQLTQFIVSQNAAAFFGDNEGGRAGAVTKITAGEDGTLRAFLEKLDALIETGGYKHIEDDIKSEFAQGLHAMVLQSSSKLGAMDALMPGQYMTAYLPKVNAGDTSGAAVGGSSLNIFDRGDDERLNAAWDFVEFLMQPENQYKFNTASGYLPVTAAAGDYPAMQEFYAANPHYKVALDQLIDTNPMAQEPMELVYSEVNKIITSTMLDFGDRKLSVDQAVEKIVGGINAALDEYNEANG